MYNDVHKRSKSCAQRSICEKDTQNGAGEGNHAVPPQIYLNHPAVLFPLTFLNLGAVLSCRGTKNSPLGNFSGVPVRFPRHFTCIKKVRGFYPILYIVLFRFFAKTRSKQLLGRAVYNDVHKRSKSCAQRSICEKDTQNGAGEGNHAVPPQIYLNHPAVLFPLTFLNLGAVLSCRGTKNSPLGNFSGVPVRFPQHFTCIKKYGIFVPYSFWSR